MERIQNSGDRLRDIRRSLSCLLLRWRFRLFQRHRHGRLVLEEVAGRPILVLPQVFNPKLFRTGAFLAESLNTQLIPRRSHVLDMGTGSGVGAVFAARWAHRVVAVDVNRQAVRCAQINALLHRVEDRVDVREGDLFEPVAGERFDVVLFNPPFFHGKPGDALEGALWSEDVVERFAASLRQYLTSEGFGLVVLSSDADVASFLRSFHKNGLHTAVVAQQDFMNERLTVHRLTR